MSQRAADALMKVIAGGALDNDALQELLNELEWIVTGRLKARHKFWQWESLDGIFASRAEVIDGRTVAILGQCILISDQTLTPIQVRVTHESDTDVAVSGRVGQSGSGVGGMERVPYGSDEPMRSTVELLSEVKVDWVYDF